MPAERLMLYYVCSGIAPSVLCWCQDALQDGVHTECMACIAGAPVLWCGAGGVRWQGPGVAPAEAGSGGSSGRSWSQEADPWADAPDAGAPPRPPTAALLQCGRRHTSAHSSPSWPRRVGGGQLQPQQRRRAGAGQPDGGLVHPGVLQQVRAAQQLWSPCSVTCDECSSWVLWD